MASKRFEIDLREQLRDPEFAVAYLTAAMEDDAGTAGIDGFLHAIREIALSREGGISGAAREAHIGRQTIYDGFKQDGNPQIRTVDAILRTIGLRLDVHMIDGKPMQATALKKTLLGSRPKPSTVSDSEGTGKRRHTANRQHAVSNPRHRAGRAPMLVAQAPSASALA